MRHTQLRLCFFVTIGKTDVTHHLIRLETRISISSIQVAILQRIEVMDEPPETKYEDYFHKEGERAALREEFHRRQQAGWSLWKVDPDGDQGAVLQFKYPSDWATPLNQRTAKGKDEPPSSEKGDPQLRMAGRRTSD